MDDWSISISLKDLKSGRTNSNLEDLCHLDLDGKWTYRSFKTRCWIQSHFGRFFREWICSLLCLQWYLMRYVDSVPWYLVLSYGVSQCVMVSYSVSWCLTVCHGVLQCHGVSQCVMVSHSVSWCLLVSHDISCCLLVSHSVSWCLTVCHGVLQCVMVSHSVSWCLAECHGVS